jgi:hypothetical protein
LPVDQRSCTSPPLPTPHWGPTESGGLLTPAEEYPSVRDVCFQFATGSEPLNTRTRGWLEQAHDYLLHGANDQAGVIAAQLCAESRFQSLACLDGGSSSSSRNSLAEMHREACDLADVTLRSTLAREALEANEVRPLTYTMYGHLYDYFADELEHDVDQHDVQAAALQVIRQLESDIQTAAANAAHNLAQNAANEAGWYAQQEATNQQMASGYLDSIRGVERRIQATKLSLGVNEHQLEDRLSASLQGARDAFDDDIHNADATAKKQMVVDAGKGIFSIGLAVLSGPVAALSALKDSASTLAGDVFDYFRCSPIAIHAYDAINRHLGGVNSALSSHGLGTVNAYDIGSCDLNHLDCGHLDHDACDADKATITNALEQLSDFQAFVGSLDGLAQLSNIALDPNAEASATDLPRVALLRSSLGVIDASTSIQLFTEAATLGNVASDVNQLVALLTSKLDMLGNYYKAKLASQNFAVRRQMFVRQAARVNALAADTTAGAADSAARTAEWSAALEAYWERHMLDRCYVALLFYAQQSQALQFIALQKNRNLAGVLEQLQARRHSANEFKDLLILAHNHLTLQYANVLQSSNNCGGGCWSVVDFQLADLPANTFASDGSLTVSIDIPPTAGYGHVTYSDARVYLIGLEGAPVTLQFSKQGSSKVLDDDGNAWSFTHMSTNPPYRFGYEPDTCEATTRPLSGSNGNNLCNLNAVYVKYPPYGMWDVQVINAGALELSAVTAIRFAFLLSTVALDSTRVPSTDGVTVFKPGSDGQGVCVRESVAGHCRSGSSSVSPPALTPAPAAEDGASCASYPEFLPFVSAVGSACCSTTADCDSNGVPTSCTPKCAEVLLPMQRACADFLVVLGMQASIAAVAATCPAPGMC